MLNNEFPEPVVCKIHPLYLYHTSASYIWSVEDDPRVEIPDFGMGDNNLGLFCRTTDPFNPKRVARILELVEIGPDLEDHECRQVSNTVAEYADIFTQSIMEVTPVKGAIHTLDIPEGKVFGKKINQRPLRASERTYYYSRIQQDGVCQGDKEDLPRRHRL